MNEIKRICVFCGSNSGNDIAVAEAAETLADLFVDKNISLVYGAGKIGVMGILAERVLKKKGVAIGIIPSFLKIKEVVHLGLTELITTETMHERKMKMQEASDGFITLPGGLGTLEEMFEILTWLQLGLHNKPVGLLNVNGFFNDLINLLENMVRKGFLTLENYKLLQVDSDPEKLLQKMQEFQRPNTQKWLSKNRV